MIIPKAPIKKHCSSSVVLIILALACASLQIVTEKSRKLLPSIGVVSVNDNHYYGEVQDKPKLNLTFQNDTVYVVPAGVAEVVIECRANYPIMWNLVDSDINPEIFAWLTASSQRYVSDMFDPTTFNYSTQLFLRAAGLAYKLTGNYSCQSTANHKIQSNVFMFWEGLISFAYGKETLTVFTNKKDEIILPCGLSTPSNSVPTLRKEISGRKPEVIGLNDSVIYSKTQGFILKKIPNPVGLYRCLFKEDDYVIVKVKRYNETFQTLKKINSTANFTYDEEKNEIVCCSNGKKAPSIIHLSCNHAVTCQYREHSLKPIHYLVSKNKRKGKCAIQSLINIHSGLIRCIGNGIDEYKEFISPIQIFNQPWNLKRNITTYFRWEEIDPQKMLNVALKSEARRFDINMQSKPMKPIYSKQQLDIECHVSGYYFSQGTQWAVRWKNKTVVPFSKAAQLDLNSDAQPIPIPSLGFDNFQITAHPDMEALICFAPVWNSSVWIPKSYFLYVNESSTPLITTNPGEQLEFSWYVNETSKTIECEAVGTPKPSISWLKGSLSLHSNSHNYNISEVNLTSPGSITKTKSILKILRVSYMSHGEYSCVASNVGGSVSKVFVVNVLERRAWGAIIVSIISGLIICGFLGVIIYLARMRQTRITSGVNPVRLKDPPPSITEEAVETEVNNSSYDNGKISNLLID